ncbi:hypothetical protein [Novosphingobium sp.]|uniref:hypothetical protein n=1 Tax=Novosphingobium sp. TaxID=1874826 RepID=UPI0038BD4BBF
MTPSLARTHPLPRIPRARLAAPRAPHPSWRLQGDPAASKRALSAEDFWRRLDP